MYFDEQQLVVPASGQTYLRNARPFWIGRQQPNQLVERCPFHSVFPLEETNIFRVVVKVAQVGATIVSRCFGL